jgi:hypothetical protein
MKRYSKFGYHVVAVEDEKGAFYRVSDVDPLIEAKDKEIEDLKLQLQHNLSDFVRKVRQTAEVVRDGDPSDCYWTGFALEELIGDFGLDKEGSK